MTSVAFLMLCAAALLGTALLAIASARTQAATSIVYSATLVISVAAAAAAVAALIGRAATPADLVLPIGVPWIGAHFRIDVLAAFFLAVSRLSGCHSPLLLPGCDELALRAVTGR